MANRSPGKLPARLREAICEALPIDKPLHPRDARARVFEALDAAWAGGEREEDDDPAAFAHGGLPHPSGIWFAAAPPNPSADLYFCPSCGETERLTGYDPERLEPEDLHLAGKPWRCDACDWEAEQDGLPHLGELIEGGEREESDPWYGLARVVRLVLEAGGKTNPRGNLPAKVRELVRKWKREDEEARGASRSTDSKLKAEFCAGLAGGKNGCVEDLLAALPGLADGVSRDHQPAGG